MGETCESVLVIGFSDHLSLSWHDRKHGNTNRMCMGTATIRCKFCCDKRLSHIPNNANIYMAAWIKYMHIASLTYGI